MTLSTAQVGSQPSAMSQRICDTLFFNASFSGTPTETETVSSDSVPTKPLLKFRRRKPQRPGKTAKDHDRHFVVHNYHDHSRDVNTEPLEPVRRRRGGVKLAFPLKLHALLDEIEADGLAHVISWQPHGRCFVVHNPKLFVEQVMPHYFSQSKLTSFQRQLNLYGFQRLTRDGRDSGGYYHELFLRGKPFLCEQMTRTKVKGTGFKAASSPQSEPDFWRMPPVNTVTPCHTSDDDSSSEYSGSYTSSSSSHCQQQAVKPCVALSHPGALTFVPVDSTIPASFSFTVPAEPEEEAVTQAAASRSFAALEPDFQVSNPGTTSLSTASDTTSESLDEVVDDLFINEPPAESDCILDFVNDWCTEQEAFYGDLEIEDDEQLGRLLEQMLE